MNLTGNITEILWIFALTLIILWIIRKFLEYKKYPPGPIGFPFIGYLPALKTEPHKLFIYLEQKYGKVFSVPIGLYRIVVINDGNLAKQVLNHPAALARPAEFDKFVPGEGGFAALNGKEWVEQRRFCVSAMKTLGMGRGEWEMMTQEEAFELIKEIKSWKGKPKDYMTFLKFSESNNILSLLIGKRLFTDKYSEEAQLVMNCSDIIIQFVSALSIANNAPIFVTKLLGKLKIANFDIFLQTMNDFETILKREIRRHLESRKPGQVLNFIDYYIEELNKQTGSDETHYFSEKSLLGNMASMFLAAIDTTMASMNWLLLLTAYYPEVQGKVRQEINDVIGSDRLIYWDERTNLPYTMATINEMLRWVVTVPLFPPRQVTSDIKIDNYIIPKGGLVIVNNWKLLRTATNFRNPEHFNPERFLKNNESGRKSENYIPFSTGKRNCPGEQVAMMTIFLFYTSIMQKFRIVCPEGKCISLKDTGSWLVRHPVPQELCFIEI